LRATRKIRNRNKHIKTKPKETHSSKIVSPINWRRKNVNNNNKKKKEKKHDKNSTRWQSQWQWELLPPIENTSFGVLDGGRGGMVPNSFDRGRPPIALAGNGTANASTNTSTNADADALVTATVAANP
jgi:hypothetical protein